MQERDRIWPEIAVIFGDHGRVRAPVELRPERDFQAVEGAPAADDGAERRARVVDVDVLAVVRVRVEVEEVALVVPTRVSHAIERLQIEPAMLGPHLGLVNRDERDARDRRGRRDRSVRVSRRR